MTLTFFKLEGDKYMKSFFLKGKELQRLIEQAYLDYLRQGKVREKFRFTTAGHEYNLLFGPPGMYQVNLRTCTRRQVKRQPSKGLSNEGIEGSKRFE